MKSDYILISNQLNQLLSTFLMTFYVMRKVNSQVRGVHIFETFENRESVSFLSNQLRKSLIKCHFNPHRLTWVLGHPLRSGAHQRFSNIQVYYGHVQTINISLNLVHKFFCFFFLIFVGHMSICGATDTPVSDFW